MHVSASSHDSSPSQYLTNSSAPRRVILYLSTWPLYHFRFLFDVNHSTQTVLPSAASSMLLLTGAALQTKSSPSTTSTEGATGAYRSRLGGGANMCRPRCRSFKIQPNVPHFIVHEGTNAQELCGQRTEAEKGAVPHRKSGGDI